MPVPRYSVRSLPLGSLLTLLVLLAVGVAPWQPAPGRALAAGGSGVRPEIVGGKPVPQGTYAFMAQVLIEKNGSTYLCGGALVDPTHVLTAGHCVSIGGPVLSPGAFTLVIGLVRPDDATPAETYHVTAVARHPSYDPDTSDFDAAVLTLDRAVPGDIAPLTLVPSGDTALEQTGQRAKVAGWGKTKQNGYTSYVLRQVGVLVRNDATCAERLGMDPTVDLCAAKRGKDSCGGDSGGPLFVIDTEQPTQIGIVSWGYGCARRGYPGVYTRLSNPAINDWIRAQLV